MAKSGRTSSGSGSGASRFDEAVDRFFDASERFGSAADAMSAAAMTIQVESDYRRVFGSGSGAGEGWGGGTGGGGGGTPLPAGGGKKGGKLTREWHGLDTTPHAVASLAFLADKATDAAGKLGKFATAIQEASESAGSYASQRRSVVDNVPFVGEAANKLVGGLYSAAYHFTEEGRYRSDPARREYENYGRERERTGYAANISQAGKLRDLEDRLAEAEYDARFVPGARPVTPRGQAALGGLSASERDRLDPRALAAQTETVRAQAEVERAAVMAARSREQLERANQTANPYFRGGAGEAAAAGADPGRMTAGQEPKVPGELHSPAAMAARLDAYRLRSEAKDGDPHAAERGLRDELKRQADYLTKAGAEQQQQREAIIRAQERAVTLAEKEFAVAQSKTNEMRTQAGLMHERADRAENAEVSYGMMDPAQQEYTKALALRFKEQGFNALTPEEKSRLAGFDITSDAIRKGAKEQAEGDAGLQALYKEFGKQTATQLREQAVKLDLNVTQQVVIDEQKVKNAIMSANEESNKQLKESLMKEFELLKLQLVNQQTQGAISRSR